MESPQIEDGYTRFANSLLEAFCRTRIAGQAYQVVLCVARMTYGYQKKCDSISYGQISELSGIQRHKIVPIVRSLTDMKILTVTNNGNTKPATIGINKHFNEWSTVPKKGVPNIGVPKNRNSTVTNNGYSTVPNIGTHQRKKEIKESIPSIFFEKSKGFLETQAKNHPSLVKISDSKVKAGALALEQLVRIDKYDLEKDILPSLRWAVGDEFWSTNILSLAGLRKQSKNGETKFQNLMAAYSRNGHSKPSNPDPDWY